MSAVARDVARAQRQAEAEEKRRLRELERLRREAQRAKLLAEKEAKLQYVEGRAASVDDANGELQARIEELRAILHHTLQVHDAIDFSSLKLSESFPQFMLSPELAEPIPIPQQDAFLRVVSQPTWLHQIIPGSLKRFEERLRVAQSRYENAVKEHNHAVEIRKKEIQEAKKAYLRRREHALQKAAQRNQEVAEFEAAYRAGDVDAVVAYNSMVLERSIYPEGFPKVFRVAWSSESRELAIEYQLPDVAVIPTIAEYRYVKTRDQIDEKPRKPAEIKELYQELVAATCLRTIHEVFEADHCDFIQVAAFNGLVESVDRATGRDIRPCIVSVRTTRDRFVELKLNRIDKKVCLRNLGANVSPQPTELVAVKPVVDLNMVDRRFDARATSEIPSSWKRRSKCPSSKHALWITRRRSPNCSNWEKKGCSGSTHSIMSTSSN
jgi:restriction system protein